MCCLQSRIARSSFDFLFCFCSEDLAPLNDCTIVFTDEIFAIEADGTQKNLHIDGIQATPTKRKSVISNSTSCPNQKLFLKIQSS